MPNICLFHMCSKDSNSGHQACRISTSIHCAISVASMVVWLVCLLILFIIVCLFVLCEQCASIHMCTDCISQFFPSTMWGLGIQLIVIVIIISVWVCVCTMTHRGQRITLWSWFSSFTCLESLGLNPNHRHREYASLLAGPSHWLQWTFHLSLF